MQNLGSVAQAYNNPYMLHTSDGDLLIFGARDTHQQPLDTILVNRLNGRPFRVPLLEQWKPVYFDLPVSSDICFIGDKAAGDYSYLLSATDKDGQLGIVLVRDTCFSLLPTVCPIPMRSQFGNIFYKGPIAVDRQHRRGYVIGIDTLCRRQYVLAVEYSQLPAKLTLYVTDTLQNAAVAIPLVTPDGDLILVGGVAYNNYKPFATVWRYHFGTEPVTSSSHVSLWGSEVLP